MTLTVALVLGAACSTQKPPPIGDEDVGDASITAAIKTQLIKEQLGLVREIRVITHRGHVVLSGEVGDEQQKQRAGDIARQASGVREVSNELKVAPSN